MYRRMRRRSGGRGVGVDESCKVSLIRHRSFALREVHLLTVRDSIAYGVAEFTKGKGVGGS